MLKNIVAEESEYKELIEQDLEAHKKRAHEIISQKTIAAKEAQAKRSHEAIEKLRLFEER